MSYYTMLRPTWPDYAEILPGELFVGGKARTPDEYIDLAEKVGLVIDCRLDWESPERVERPRWEGLGVEYLRLPVNDDFKPKDAAWFDAGVSAALEAIGEGRAVYCHCNMGINRGPSMAYAVLRALGYSKADAFHMLLSKRSIVRCAYKDDADRALGELGFATPLAS